MSKQIIIQNGLEYWHLASFSLNSPFPFLYADVSRQNDLDMNTRHSLVTFGHHSILVCHLRLCLHKAVGYRTRSKNYEMSLQKQGIFVIARLAE